MFYAKNGQRFVKMFCFRYLEASGIPEEFVQLLADNYTGTAQAANLLADWLIVAGKCR